MSPRQLGKRSGKTHTPPSPSTHVRRARQSAPGGPPRPAHASTHCIGPSTHRQRSPTPARIASTDARTPAPARTCILVTAHALQVARSPRRLRPAACMHVHASAPAPCIARLLACAPSPLHCVRGPGGARCKRAARDALRQGAMHTGPGDALHRGGVASRPAVHCVPGCTQRMQARRTPAAMHVQPWPRRIARASARRQRACLRRPVARGDPHVRPGDRMQSGRCTQRIAPRAVALRPSRATQARVHVLAAPVGCTCTPVMHCIPRAGCTCR